MMPDQSLYLSISLRDSANDEKLDRLTRRLRDEIPWDIHSEVT